jgi:hypothetical protein
VLRGGGRGDVAAAAAAVVSMLKLRVLVWCYARPSRRSGFSVLLHGLGSKRGVLEAIASEQLTDGAVVTCNGFVRSLTAHKVVAAAAGALTGRGTK